MILRPAEAGPKSLKGTLTYTALPSTDKSGAEKIVAEFKDYVETEVFIFQQIFTCDKTVLFWKCITKEENALTGHKPMKDRLTLLFLL